MKKNMIGFCGLILILISVSCEKDPYFLSDHGVVLGHQSYTNAKVSELKGKTTGGIEVMWNGNSGDGQVKRVFVEYNAFDQSEDKGEFVFTVKGLNNKLHRQIVASVYDVLVIGNKAWFLATVESDTKACTAPGGPGGGHDDGEVCDHDDPGDTCDDSDDGTDHGGSHDEGCLGGDEGHGGSNGSVSGQNCRIGQILAVKVHDVATPATNGDGITWKWFNPAGNATPQNTLNVTDWPHLCRKEILGGNLVVH